MSSTLHAKARRIAHLSDVHMLDARPSRARSVSYTHLTRTFLDYMTGADFQERSLPSVKGFIPITQMKVSRDKD